MTCRCLLLVLLAAACGAEPLPAEPEAPLASPTSPGGKADSAAISYRVSLVGLEPIAPPLNQMDPAQELPDLGRFGKVCPDAPVQCGGGRCCLCSRFWDSDHAYLAVSIGNTSGPTYTTATSSGADGYFSTAFRNAQGVFEAARVDYVSRPGGDGCTVREWENPRPPAPIAIEEIVVAPRADHRIAITVLADSRTDPGTRALLASTEAEQLCYARSRAERTLRGEPVENLPAFAAGPAGCGPIWTFVPGGDRAPRRRGEAIESGCDGYTADHTFTLDGAALAELTRDGRPHELTCAGGACQDLLSSSCWHYSNAVPGGRQPQWATTGRRVRVVVERMGAQVFDPEPPGDCTLRPIADAATTALVRTWGDSGSTWQDQLAAIIDRARGSTIATLFRLRGQTRETAPPGLTRDSLGNASVKDQPAFRRNGCLASPTLCLAGGAPPKPVHPRCKRFANVTCPGRGPLGLRFLGCYIDNGRDADRALSLDVAPDVALSLYGEFAGDGTLLEHRLRYRRASADGTSIDHMLRRSTEPPR